MGWGREPERLQETEKLPPRQPQPGTVADTTGRPAGEFERCLAARTVRWGEDAPQLAAEDRCVTGARRSRRFSVWRFRDLGIRHTGRARLYARPPFGESEATMRKFAALWRTHVSAA